MFDTVLGLPLHPLIVHATVVVVPVAALLVIAVAFIAPMRRWARWITPIVAVTAAGLVPVTTRSGQALHSRLGGESPLIRSHAALGDQMLPWAVAVAVMALILTWVYRPRAHAARDARHGDDVAAPPRALGLAVSLGAVVAGVGALVQIARVGHSGAVAVWSQIATSGAPLF